MTIHPALSIQASQGIPSGSITTGYPIRTQPSVSSFQGRPPSPHVRVLFHTMQIFFIPLVKGYLSI